MDGARFKAEASLRLLTFHSREEGLRGGAFHQATKPHRAFLPRLPEGREPGTSQQLVALALDYCFDGQTSSLSISAVCLWVCSEDLEGCWC